MSKKHKFSKHIQKGRFYHIHEGSPTGHPGMIYWKNDRKNLYLAFTTDTSNGQNRTKLTVPTEKGVSESYVNNRPLLAKRKNIGGIRPNLKFNKNDRKLLKEVSKKPFRSTSDINRKDRRFIKRLKKKPKY